jgi:multimeric flavodoxin WrbA
MKILGIIGSPRKGSNSFLLVDKVAEGAKSQWAEVELIILSELNISPCKACMSCKEKGVCAIKDDMISLTEKMKGADAFILASPVYWGDVSAQMKTWIDRSYCLMDLQFNTPLKGKKAALIAVCANPEENMLDHSLKTLAQFCAFNQMKVVGELKAPGFLMPGQVKEKEDLLKQASALGTTLAGEK